MNLTKLPYILLIFSYHTLARIMPISTPNQNINPIQQTFTQLLETQSQKPPSPQFQSISNYRKNDLVCPAPYRVGSYVPPISISYENYIKKYKCKCEIGNRGPGEQIYRRNILAGNIARMNAHNSNSSRTYDMGLNEFSDLSEAEFKAIYTTLIIPSNNQQSHEVESDGMQSKPFEKTKQFINQKILPAIAKRQGSSDPLKQLLNVYQNTLQQPSSQPTPKSYPTSNAVDWSCINVPIKNQGKCGSCYAIIATDMIEFSYKINTKQPIFPLSYQELVSCGKPQKGMYGCSGGFYDGAFQYVKTHGVGMYTFYPYSADSQILGETPACYEGLFSGISKQQYDLYRKNIVTKSYISHGDCNGLINILQKKPVAAAIASDGLQFYSNGLFLPSSSVADHGVVIIGYSPQKGFKARNSWGNSWGPSGLGTFYLSQESGVCDHAMYITIQNQLTNPTQCPNPC